MRNMKPSSTTSFPSSSRGPRFSLVHIVRFCVLLLLVSTSLFTMPVEGGFKEKKLAALLSIGGLAAAGGYLGAKHGHQHHRHHDHGHHHHHHHHHPKHVTKIHVHNFNDHHHHHKLHHHNTVLVHDDHHDLGYSGYGGHGW